MAELLVLDFDYRYKRGEQPSPQEYLQRFPQDTAVVQSALDDRTELAKTSRFVPPTIDELASLFPALEILDLIGCGGMGAVYKARQKGLDRLVALKVLPDEIGRNVKFALRLPAKHVPWPD